MIFRGAEGDSVAPASVYGAAFVASLLLIAHAAGGCGSSEQPGTASSSTATGAGGAGGGVTSGGGGTAGAGGLFTGSGEEVCDGLDNDDDGDIDEVCSCAQGATQQCYPAPHEPPEGCRWGEQACDGMAWAGCKGASLPPEGKDACCTALGETPEHAAYDGYLAAYPADKMPKSVAAIQAFVPMLDDQKMKWAETKVADEFVDKSYGGMISENVAKGRDFVRGEAEKSMPQGAAIVAEKQSDIVIEKLGGTPPCDGVGWAWGSLLYQTPDDAVGEIVYLYVGFCNDGDIDGYYYSEVPVVVCEPPRVPS